MIRFMVDSASDCSIKDSKVDYLVPLTVNVDGTEYLDGVTMDSNQFYTMLENCTEFPKTSCPAPQRFVEMFEQVKEANDTLIYISLSAGLSGTYQSAVLAKEIVEYDNIYIVNSASASHGIRILLEYGQKLASEGMDAEAIVEKMEQLKTRIKIIAGVDTLEYLCKGGRVSKTAATVGELANIKPLITITDEGKVDAYCKCLGVVRAIKHIFCDFGSLELDENFPLYSVYTNGEENVEKLEKKLTTKGYTISDRKQIGCTIGAHVGPEAYGLIFVCK